MHDGSCQQCTRRPAAVAISAAEGADAPKANIDDGAVEVPKEEGGTPEDSDADPDADVLVATPQGLSSAKEGEAKEIKGAERPWTKNVRK